MKIPFVTSDDDLCVQAARACAEFAERDELAALEPFEIVGLEDTERALEYINYQTPPLLLINFSDERLDGFDLMNRIVEDPWLNHGAIIAAFRGSETLERVNGLVNTNIVFALPLDELPRQMVNVLGVVQNNRQILFQRAMQKELLTDLTGRLVLENEISIVPLYANLIANYLYNMDFIEASRRLGIGFALTEMLINAIEHGNCEIGGKEKGAALAAGQSVVEMIRERARRPEIAGRRVHFGYEIHPTHSVYTVRDEGPGFDWRVHMERAASDDPMMLLNEHGRGIWMTHTNVDDLRYNDAGNEVTLRVDHRRNVSNTLPLGFGVNDMVAFEPGEVVFQEGEESDFLYYIAEGEFRVEVNGRLLSVMTPADLLVGEMSFLLEDTRSATVIANSPGKLIKISKEAFVESIKSKPYYGLFLARLLAQRLQRLSHRFMS